MFTKALAPTFDRIVTIIVVAEIQNLRVSYSMESKYNVVSEQSLLVISITT